MHRNPVWIAFLLFIAAVTAFFCFKAAKEVYDYSVLTESALTDEISFTVSSVALDAYAPKATYSFTFHGHTYHGSDTLATYAANPTYIKELIPKLESAPHPVFFDPEDPAINALQRVFPLAAVIKGSALLILALYFTWLGFRAKL